MTQRHKDIIVGTVCLVAAAPWLACIAVAAAWDYLHTPTGRP